jgi:hypothetical protein
MKKKTIHSLITGSLFMGVLAFNPSAQAEKSPTIDNSCIFFNKVVFHVKDDIIINPNFTLYAKDTREFILLGKYQTPTNVTLALVDGLCANKSNCPHTPNNTIIDSVEFSADCDNSAIRKLTRSTD